MPARSCKIVDPRIGMEFVFHTIVCKRYGAGPCLADFFGGGAITRQYIPPSYGLLSVAIRSQSNALSYNIRLRRVLSRLQLALT